MSGGETVVLERLHEHPGGEELAKLARAPSGRGPRRRCRPRPAAGANAQGARRGRLGRGAALRRRAAGDARAASARAPPCSPSTIASGRRPWCGRRAGSTSPSRRAESYPEPGALPEVRTRKRTRRTSPAGTSPSTPSPSRCPASGPGELVAARARPRGPRGGAAAGCSTTRSFIDDPTRLLRLARYRARLGFEIEPHTAELAALALQRPRPRHRLGGTHRAPSCGSRWRKPTGWRRCESLGRLGVLGALGLAGPSTGRAPRAPSSCCPRTAPCRRCCWDSLLLRKPPRRRRARGALMRGLLDGLEFGAGERERALRAAFDGAALAERMARSPRPLGAVRDPRRSRPRGGRARGRARA